MNGHTPLVSFVGAGPGAPDLLTLRATKALAEADIVFTDALVHPETLALAARALIVEVGKRDGKPSTRQAFINSRLVEASRRYARVIRLKGGDPAIFARLDEEIACLQEAGVAFEIIPGVTAVSAAAAELGMPLTCRGVARRLVVVTPRVGEREAQSPWSSGLTPGDTLAIYMGRRQADAVQAELLAVGFGADTPVAVIEGASFAGAQKLLGSLGELPRLASATGAGPVIMLVGAVLNRSGCRTSSRVPCADGAPAAWARRDAPPAVC